MENRQIKLTNYLWRMAFSFLQHPRYCKKIKSYSHGEFNTEENTNEINIEKKIKNNQDIFGRGFSLKKIVIDESFPDYILRNKEKLKNWII